MAVQSRLIFLPQELVIYLLEWCSLPTLSRLASASSLFDNLIAFELTTRYNHLLRPFVTDPIAFRSKLTEFESVLSGSAAFALCSPRDVCVPGDLDIYVGRFMGEKWVEYLKTAEGYIEAGRDHSGIVDNVYHGGLHQVVTLVRASTRLRKESKIDVVFSLTASATLPIPHFWMTAVMSFVTEHGIASLYPRLQEQYRGLLSPGRSRGPSLPKLKSSYRERGIDIRSGSLDFERQLDPLAVCAGESSPDCPLTVRWIGDRHCLIRGFGNVNDRMDSLVLQGAVASLTTVWWRGGRVCGGACVAPGGVVHPDVFTQSVDRVS